MANYLRLESGDFDRLNVLEQAEEIISDVPEVHHYLFLFPDGHFLTEPEWNSLKWSRKIEDVRSSLLNGAIRKEEQTL